MNDCRYLGLRFPLFTQVIKSPTSIKHLYWLPVLFKLMSDIAGRGMRPPQKMVPTHPCPPTKHQKNRLAPSLSNKNAQDPSCFFFFWYILGPPCWRGACHVGIIKSFLKDETHILSHLPFLYSSSFPIKYSELLFSNIMYKQET